MENIAQRNPVQSGAAPTNIINLGILAHVDAGKTTLTEGLLVRSGAKRAMGRVDSGTTTTDSLLLERQRGITIRASTISFPWAGAKINLIDTPGHMDFIAEVERSLAVLDGVVLVVSAKEGVQPQTRVIFAKLRAMRIPTLLFINKVDRAGVSLERVYRDIREKLDARIVPMQAVHGEGTREAGLEALHLGSGALHEAIVAESDALMADFLAGRPITASACLEALRGGVRGCELFPVYHGAALHGLGVAELLDAVPLFLRGGGDETAPLSAMVYKIDRDESGRRRLYLRMFSGALAVRDRVNLPNASGDDPDAPAQTLQVKALMALSHGQPSPTDRLAAGDIGVLLDAPALRCGDFLGCVTELRLSAAPPPLLIAALAPRVPAQRPALLDALAQFTEEDPSLQFRLDSRTGEISLRLYGPLQREIIEAMVLERFGLAVAFSPLATLYKAQPLGPAIAEMRINSPGNLHRAGIALAVEPLPSGSGNEYVTRVSFGDLTKSFQTGVEEGVRAGLAEGLGWEIVDTRVAFTGMDFDSVTSTPADYRRLAPLVLQRAFEASGLRRMEPWLRFSALVPSDFQKKALLAIGKLRANLETIAYTEAECTVHGEVPLDTAKDFASELASLSQGQGIFTSSFLEYREV